MVIGDSVLTTLFTVQVQRDNRWRTFPQEVEYLPSLKDGTSKVDGERMTLLWRIKPRNWQSQVIFRRCRSTKEASRPLPRVGLVNFAPKRKGKALYTLYTKYDRVHMWELASP